MAVKVFEERLGHFEEIEQEAKIMTKLGNHPNVIPFIGLAHKDGKIYLLTKLCSHGSLHDYFIKTKTSSTYSRMNKIILQMCIGLNYLHLNQVIHRDVACRNFLLDADQRVYISDFGMSRMLVSLDAVQSTAAQEGPIRWMAPESLGEKMYSTKSDVYMFGITLWELLTREIPFGAYLNLLDVFEAVIRGERPDIPSDTPAPYQFILTSCWQTDPHARMSLEKMIEILTDYSASLGCNKNELDQMKQFHLSIDVHYEKMD